MSEESSAPTPETGSDAPQDSQIQGTPTDDGTGGKASLLTEPTPEKSEGEEGKVDIKSLLGEDLAGNEKLSKFLDSENPIQDIAKALLEDKPEGSKGIPGENSSDEEKAAFYKELGVPDDADGYGFERPEGFPEEAYDPEDAKEWAQFFKDNNLTKEQANAARDRFIEKQMADHQKSTEVLNEALKSAFGDETDAIAKQTGELMKKAIPDDSLRQQIANAIGNKDLPAFSLALGHVMKYMKKTYGLSDQNAGDDGNANSGKSLEELRGDAKKLMESEAYRDPMHRDHASIKKQVNQMYKDIGTLTTQKK